MKRLMLSLIFLIAIGDALPLLQSDGAARAAEQPTKANASPQDEDDGKDPASASGKPAEEVTAGNETAGNEEQDDALTVAVLSFGSDGVERGELGKQITAALTAMLSGRDAFTLVERQSLERALQEQELSLTGLVQTDRAVKVGRLVGAKVLITGRAFVLGQKLFVTAKLIGTETSLVEGVMVNGSRDADLGKLVIELANKAAEVIQGRGGTLVAEPLGASDPVPALRKRLAERALPTVAVVVREQHHASRRPQRRAVDPAVETELKRLLGRCGFTVRDVPANELTSFVKRWELREVERWPRGLQDVDVLVAGEGFSEFASRIGNLVSTSARVELNAIRRRDGEILYADRTTARSVDLSEQVAGKKALQKAGRIVGLRLLERWAETLPKKQRQEEEKRDAQQRDDTSQDQQG